MDERKFSLRMLRILARQFVASAQEGNSSKCRLIFYSMLYACRAFEGGTVKLAKEIVNEVIKAQITASVGKTGKPQVVAIKELKACLKIPMTAFEEMTAAGYRPVPFQDIYGDAGEGVQ